jgi:hypothetical protein
LNQMAGKQLGPSLHSSVPAPTGLDGIDETACYGGLVQLASALRRRSAFEIGGFGCQIASCRGAEAPTSCRPRLAGLRLKEMRVGKFGSAGVAMVGSWMTGRARPMQHTTPPRGCQQRAESARLRRAVTTAVCNGDRRDSVDSRSP